jgi:hypothetical protein
LDFRIAHLSNSMIFYIGIVAFKRDFGHTYGAAKPLRVQALCGFESHFLRRYAWQIIDAIMLLFIFRNLLTKFMRWPKHH